MNRFPSWDERYEQGSVEQMPWYWPAIDPDLEAALARHGVTSGRFLDLGTGPGTQAKALALRGFTVTATDISPAAIAYASRGSKATFVVDDILATKLTGPFDAIFDRGCFHVLAPERRADYARTIKRLLAPGGFLFLKTFSDEQSGTQGPYRFAPDELRSIFANEFDVLEVLRTVYHGQLDPFPKALFATIRPL